MKANDCFGKRLLKRVPASIEKARKNLESADLFLSDAQANFKENRYESALMLAYSAVFNAAKALLLRDGVSEASHYCVMVYLKEEYEELADMISTFDHFRSRRHFVQYAAVRITSQEAEEFLSFSRRFIARIKQVIR